MLKQFSSETMWTILVLHLDRHFKMSENSMIWITKPGVNFIKALTRAFFYWRENANKIVLAFETPLFWQQILNNMLPI